MWLVWVCAILALTLLLYEFRFRRPDRIVLYESKGQVRRRRIRFYPRHLSLTIPTTFHSNSLEVGAEAKGRLSVCIRLTVTVAASLECLPALIRVGGWNEDAINQANAELEVMLQSIVREFAEKYEIEELSAEKLSNYLQNQLGKTVYLLGLELLSVNVQSIEPGDEKIAEAIRQREADRILEQTEVANQNARVAAAKARIRADSSIALSEHNFELKKLELKKTKEEREAELARLRVEEELERRKMQLEVDRQEIELFKNNPELIVLTPQVARLAEASQSFRNARTIVSFSHDDFAESSPIMRTLQNLLQNIGRPAQKADLREKNRKG